MDRQQTASKRGTPRHFAGWAIYHLKGSPADPSRHELAVLRGHGYRGLVAAVQEAGYVLPLPRGRSLAWA